MSFCLTTQLFWKLLKFLAKLCASNEAYIRETALSLLTEIISQKEI